MLRFCLLLLGLFTFTISGLQAQSPITAQQQVSSYLALIEVNTKAELNALLQRSEQLFSAGKFRAGSDVPVAFILHGPEAEALLVGNYQENKELVDLAARLSAFKIVDIKVCKTWMGEKGLDESLLPPFIGTVPNGVAEKERLMERGGYVYF